MKLPYLKITFLFFIFLPYNLLSEHNINTQKKKSIELYITILDSCTKKSFSLINAIHKTIFYSKIATLFSIHFVVAFEAYRSKNEWYCYNCLNLGSACKCPEKLIAGCFDTIKKMVTEYQSPYNIKTIHKHLIESREQRIIYYKKIRAINIIKK